MFGKRSCVNAAWRVNRSCVKKKKKKIDPLLLYHVLGAFVKSFFKTFFRKFSCQVLDKEIFTENFSI